MAKAVILKTSEGVKLVGSFQCSNGAYWDADGCFKYCNSESSETLNALQVTKLLYNATILGFEPKTKGDWYKDKKNTQRLFSPVHFFFGSTSIWII